MTDFIFSTGTMLVTGSWDNKARIWSAKGELIHELNKHTNFIWAVQWSENNRYLASADRDGKAIVWNPEDGTVKQEFKFHTNLVRSIDWQNDKVFATSSNDRKIKVCKVGQITPVKVIRHFIKRF